MADTNIQNLFELDAPHKACSRCGQLKPLDAYSWNTYRDGSRHRSGRCKVCANKKRQATRLAAKERGEKRKQWPRRTPRPSRAGKKLHKKRRGPGTIWSGYRNGKSINITFLGEPRVCYLCGDPIDFTNAHAEHVIPISRGGPHDETNFEWACQLCNMAKRSMLLEEFFAHVKKILAHVGDRPIQELRTPALVAQLGVVVPLSPATEAQVTQHPTHKMVGRLGLRGGIPRR